MKSKKITKTMNQEENIFDKLSNDWWKIDGSFSALHAFNFVRIKFIKDVLGKKKSDNLKNLKILDIGCGGGLLSEPMSRLGANVTGIDASKNNINIAKHHLKKSKLKVNYLNCSPENLKTSKKFDVILNMEIVEHVENIDNFIKQSSKFLKKNGIMFVATLNQTLKSYLFAIIGAEYVLRWLLIGTHEWEKFVKPENLISICQKNSLKLKKIDGMTFNPLFDQWKVSSDKSVNYITEFEKV